MHVFETMPCCRFRYAAAAMLAGQASAQMPPALEAPGEAVVATLHAEGAQVYECKAGADGKLAWAFREPIATLLLDGKTVGRHYAGPNWEHTDGSAIVGKVVANAPGKTRERHSLAQARGHGAARQRHACRASPRCSGSTRRAACMPAPATRPAPSTARPTPPTTSFLRKGS